MNIHNTFLKFIDSQGLSYYRSIAYRMDNHQDEFQDECSDELYKMSATGVFVPID